MTPVAAYLALHGFFLCELTPNNFRIKRQARDFETMMTLTHGGDWCISAGANIAAYTICDWDRALDILPQLAEVDRMMAAVDNVERAHDRRTA